jgi:hypothetical protein
MKWDNVIGLPKSITFGFHAARMRDFDMGNKGAARFLKLCESARDLHSFTSVKFYFTPCFVFCSLRPRILIAARIGSGEALRSGFAVSAVS